MVDRLTAKVLKYFHMKKQFQKGGILPLAFILGVLILLAGSAVFFSRQNQKTEIAPRVIMDKEIEKMMLKTEFIRDEVAKKTSKEMIEEEVMMTYQYQGQLKDVTGGNSSGVARANFADGVYGVVAIFENLPEPTGNDFYEGWLVRQGADSSVISTGKTKTVDGQHINVYESNKDFTDHTFYVLTIEPDDGDPAPADHVLEGTLKKNIGI